VLVVSKGVIATCGLLADRADPHRADPPASGLPKGLFEPRPPDDRWVPSEVAGHTFKAGWQTGPAVVFNPDGRFAQLLWKPADLGWPTVVPGRWRIDPAGVLELTFTDGAEPIRFRKTRVIGNVYFVDRAGHVGVFERVQPDGRRRVGW
jgi:hypothetical protein